MSSPSKYDLHLNPPYMVDFSVLATGKRMGATKKKVQFKFGFSNANAMRDGLTGKDCRGEEHEVNLAWSIVSGKRTVSMDGAQVHYSMGSRTDSQFDTSFQMKGGHVLHLTAHAAMPMRDIPGFRQFDLTLDGMSIFDMPKIYELGTGRVPALGRSSQGRRAMVASTGVGYGGGPSSYPQDDYGNNDNAWARQAPAPERYPSERSIPRVVEAQQQAPPPPPAAPVVVDLIAQPVATNDHLAVPLVDTTPTTTAYGAPPPADEFAPVVPVQTYDDRMSGILSQYGPSGPSTPSKPAMLALTNGQTGVAPTSTTPNTMMSTPSSSAYAGATPPPAYNNAPEQHFFAADSRGSPTPYQQEQPVVHLSMMEDHSPTTVVQTMAPETQNDLQKAMSNLVNLDDITEPAPEQFNKLTLMKEEVEKKKQSKKSKPAPPTLGYLGSGATLGDIQSHTAQHKEPPAKEVMRTPFDPNAAQAGMMVLYGQPQQGPQFGAPLSTHDAYGRPFAAH